jgi:hypothetical protein
MPAVCIPIYTKQDKCFKNQRSLKYQPENFTAQMPDFS